VPLKTQINYASLNPSTEYSVTVPELQIGDMVGDNNVMVRSNIQERLNNKTVSLSKPYYGLTVEESSYAPRENLGFLGAATALINFLASSLGNASQEEAGNKIQGVRVWVPTIHSKNFMGNPFAITDENVRQQTIQSLPYCVVDETVLPADTKIGGNKLVKIQFIDENLSIARIIGIASGPGIQIDQTQLSASLEQVMRENNTQRLSEISGSQQPQQSRSPQLIEPQSAQSQNRSVQRSTNIFLRNLE